MVALLCHVTGPLLAKFVARGDHHLAASSITLNQIAPLSRLQLEMPLLDLANELLQSISECLELARDVNGFTRTGRDLYILLNPYLYRHNVTHYGD